jgi:phosphohistidine phosphatase
MFLYLVQHGEAHSKEEDSSRSLSGKGIKDVKKIASFSRGLKIAPHQIVHSGKMRALQTAQLLAESVTSDMGVLESDGLSPMDDPEMWFGRLSKMNEDIMIVGHLPYLDKLASLLLCRDKENRIINFDMGSIVCLKRLEEFNWSVEWFIKPGMIK